MTVKGHNNTSANDILNSNGNADGMDLSDAAKNARLGNPFRTIDQRIIGTTPSSFTGKEWEQLGVQMQTGKAEIGLTITLPNSSTNHAVSALNINVVDKLRIYGGGVKTVLESIMVVDPRGYIYSINPSRILEVVWIKY